MQIELSELLTCPDCRSPQGLVVLVDDLDDGGRVLGGSLGCSRCERHYPVRDGVVDLAAGVPGGDSPPPEAPPAEGPSREELAAEVGGLLDLRNAPGPVVLGPGLAGTAPPLASLADAPPILVLAAPGEEAPEEEARGGAFTLARGPADRLPLLSGKAGGVALWRPGPETVGDARDALAPGGRLAALRPDDLARRELEDSDLEVLASEERAAVARRSG